MGRKDYMNPDVEKETTPHADPAVAKEKPKLQASVHFMCGWPLLLVAVGGAIGGGLGGAAYGINLAIYKSKLPAVAKVLLNIVVGVGAIGIWFAIAMAIQSGRR